MRKRTGPWSVKKEHWVGKQIPKWVLLVPAESVFFDPNALSPQCLLPAVSWLQPALGTTLRTWPNPARQGALPPTAIAAHCEDLSGWLHQLRWALIWGEAEVKTQQVKPLLRQTAARQCGNPGAEIVCSCLCNCPAVQRASPGTQHCHTGLAWPRHEGSLHLQPADNVPRCSAVLTWTGQAAAPRLWNGLHLIQALLQSPGSHRGESWAAHMLQSRTCAWPASWIRSWECKHT